jgi:hypothetical protein
MAAAAVVTVAMVMAMRMPATVATGEITLTIMEVNTREAATEAVREAVTEMIREAVTEVSREAVSEVIKGAVTEVIRGMAGTL